MARDGIPVFELNGSTTPEICESCLVGKMHRMFFKPSTSVTTRVGELAHLDVCTFPIPGIDEERYMVAFVDDFSNWTAAFVIETKGKAFDCFKIFSATIKNLTNREISRIRSDRVGEYISLEWEEWLNERGTQRYHTVCDTSKQNGVAERMNRTLLNYTRTPLPDANLPDEYWPYALSTACYTRNRGPTSILPKDETPFEMLYSKKPRLDDLRSFGERCYAFGPTPKNKLAPRSSEYMFIGYSKFGDKKIHICICISNGKQFCILVKQASRNCGAIDYRGRVYVT